MICVGWFWWPPSERVTWDAAAAQTSQGHQEEAGQEDARHDQEDLWRRLRQVLEGILHQVSSIYIYILFISFYNFKVVSIWLTKERKPKRHTKIKIIVHGLQQNNQFEGLFTKIVFRIWSFLLVLTIVLCFVASNSVSSRITLTEPVWRNYWGSSHPTPKARWRPWQTTWRGWRRSRRTSSSWPGTAGMRWNNRPLSSVSSRRDTRYDLRLCF